VRACADGDSSTGGTPNCDDANHGNDCMESFNGTDNPANGTKENKGSNTISSHIVGSHRIVVMFNILIGNIIDRPWCKSSRASNMSSKGEIRQRDK